MNLGKSCKCGIPKYKSAVPSDSYFCLWTARENTSVSLIVAVRGRGDKSSATWSRITRSVSLLFCRNWDKAS